MPVVVIAGGRGLIGQKLTSHLTARNYEVIVLTRDKSSFPQTQGVTYSTWDVYQGIFDPGVFRAADAIVHLAGAGVIDQKWTEAYKQEIVNSRTKASRLLVRAYTESGSRAGVLVAATAIGWYGPDPSPLHRKEGFIETDPAADGFLAATCLDWENSLAIPREVPLRMVKLRTGIVLSADGGAYEKFKSPLKMGIAAIMGSGRQMVSWIHMEDLCRMFVESIENSQISGVYNAVAPVPVSNRKLILEMAEKVRHKFFIPVHVPGFILKLILGQRSIEVLKSATVSSRKIRESGFTFLYPSIESALAALEQRS
ncbi:MAG: TIGR01777 family oxidoreductase [Bacteroidota bacterium]|nr:TIGR01777 family oxidoreductase [Bacteroidota bacterium]